MATFNNFTWAVFPRDVDKFPLRQGEKNLPLSVTLKGFSVPRRILRVGGIKEIHGNFYNVFDSAHFIIRLITPNQTVFQSDWDTGSITIPTTSDGIPLQIIKRKGVLRAIINCPFDTTNHLGTWTGIIAVNVQAYSSLSHEYQVFRAKSDEFNFEVVAAR